MRKITFILTFFISITALAQFPGKAVDHLLNATVAPKKIEQQYQKYAYDNFYTAVLEGSYKVDITKPYQPPAGISKYNALVGKQFKVTGVYPIETQYGNYYTLVLKNDTIGILYYIYSAEYEASFELEIIKEQ